MIDTRRKKQRNEKDLSQKLLMAYPDVFADIVNVLLFDGKEIVKPEDLEDADTASMYKADGMIHPLERDVSKKWKDRTITICQIGIENQMEMDETMVIRSLSYDGFSYRAQIGRDEKPHPVITLVLYFGKKPWNKAKSLYEMLDIPEGLKPFVNDYRMNLFELMTMDEDTVKKFKSDFGMVADYLRNVNEGRYKPEKKEFKHMEEAAEIMTIFGNVDFRNAVQSVTEKGKPRNMESLLTEEEKRQLLEENTAKVTRETTAKVTRETTAKVTKELNSKRVIALMGKMNISSKEAMDYLGFTEEERAEAEALIKKTS